MHVCSWMSKVGLAKENVFDLFLHSSIPGSFWLFRCLELDFLVYLPEDDQVFVHSYRISELYIYIYILIYIYICVYIYIHIHIFWLGDGPNII